jgi:predicted nucleotidyltransferase
LQPEYQELADEYTRAIRDFFGNRLVSVAFFGSVARGTADPESDVDVLVIAEDLPKDVGLRFRETMPVHEKIRKSKAYSVLRLKGRSGFVSDLFLTPDETMAHPPILLDACDDAFLAYDKNEFLKGVLRDISMRLKELNAKKVKASKGYYWVLKPDAKPSEVVEI